MIMTSSPILTPHTRSIAHTPSPNSSPKLVPIASTMAKQASSSTSSSTGSNLPPLNMSTSAAVPLSLPTRSFVRGPQARPYASYAKPSMGGKNARDVIDGDSKRFAEIVAGMVSRRANEKRKGELVEMIENVKLDDESVSSPKGINAPKRTRSVAGSLGGSSWEAERLELIVDIPVWSPGCFQDLSTLHALRDTTLSHTHALLGHLLNTHTVLASYRLLARSCATTGHSSSSPYSHGWGCIRLAPSITSPFSAPLELKPRVRRASLVHAHSSPNHHLDNCHESVIIDSDDDDDDEDDESKVYLREEYHGGGSVSSDSEDEEETADAIVAREIERRGGKEGMAFLMTLFGQPALILT
ncbi:hypothetical protein I317_07445 [Kwoniella heveanensis CBS 569]|nr:hypothetical protein I317_07445 [Kwoniella heveanensis CBS 569]